jgi:hypothetical protein
MSVFEDQQQRRRPVKRESWPVKLAYKLGAKNMAQANLIMIIFSVIALSGTFYMYTQIIFPTQPESNNISEENLNNLPPELRQAMEESGQI